MDKVVSNRGCFHSFGGLLPQAGRGSFFTLQGLYQNCHGSLPHGEGDITAKQMHYTKSRDYQRAEVEEKSAGSVTVALGLLAPGSRKPKARMLCSLSSNV